MTVRAAQLKDVTSLAEILADSFHSRVGMMRWFYPLFRMGIQEDLRSRLRSLPADYLCLVAGKGVGGTYQLSGTVEMTLRSAYPFQPRKSQYLYLSNLAVRTDCRRQGIAQRLLAACEQIALEWGFQALYLHVLENNHQARRLYFKMGYHLQQVDPDLSSLLGGPRRLLLCKQLNSDSRV